MTDARPAGRLVPLGGPGVVCDGDVCAIPDGVFSAPTSGGGDNGAGTPEEAPRPHSGSVTSPTVARKAASNLPESTKAL